MAEIITTKGMIEESALEKKSGMIDNDRELTIWTEWYQGKELVKRDVHVRLKIPSVQSKTEIQGF